MAALAVVFTLCLYLVGLRADRIHAQRVGGKQGTWLDGAMSESGEPSSGGNGLGLGQRTPVKAKAGSEDLRPGSVTVTVPARGLYRGKSASYWAGRYRHRTRQLQQARRVLLSRPSVTEAINLAGVVYGNGSWLWRVARCESTLNPNARNGDENATDPPSGLYQFKPSTWSRTPFGSFSIYSANASALAAGWMRSQGRASEWACR